MQQLRSENGIGLVEKGSPEQMAMSVSWLIRRCCGMKAYQYRHLRNQKRSQNLSQRKRRSKQRDGVRAVLFYGVPQAKTSIIISASVLFATSTELSTPVGIIKIPCSPVRI